MTEPDSRPKIKLPCPNCGEWLTFTIKVNGIKRVEWPTAGWIVLPKVESHSVRHKCEGVP